MHDLQQWSEDDVSIKSCASKTKQKSSTLPKNLHKAANSPTIQVLDAKSKKTIEIFKDKLNVRYKGVQATIDKNTEKHRDQIARKTIRIATKVKDPKNFKTKYKTIDGNFLTYMAHTARIQTFGKQLRLLRNNEVTFVPNPLIYGPCRPSGLSDHIACTSTRRSRPCLQSIPTRHNSQCSRRTRRRDCQRG